jgi:hypothetical protein
MPAILQGVLSVLMSLGMKLLTETVLKKVIVIGMEAVVKRTENPEDDKLVQTIKQAWGVE